MGRCPLACRGTTYQLGASVTPRSHRSAIRSRKKKRVSSCSGCHVLMPNPKRRNTAIRNAALRPFPLTHSLNLVLLFSSECSSSIVGSVSAPACGVFCVSLDLVSSPCFVVSWIGCNVLFHTGSSRTQCWAWVGTVVSKDASKIRKRLRRASSTHAYYLFIYLFTCV